MVILETLRNLAIRRTTTDFPALCKYATFESMGTDYETKQARGYP